MDPGTLNVLLAWELALSWLVPEASAPGEIGGHYYAGD